MRTIHDTLGQALAMPTAYAPDILLAVPREQARATLTWPEGYDRLLGGVDVWHAHELSWLDGQGAPQVGMAVITIPADSKNIVESKSLKLYLNSLNHHAFESLAQLQSTLVHDIGELVDALVKVELVALDHAQPPLAVRGVCLDRFRGPVSQTLLPADYLALADGSPTSVVEEELYSTCFRSMCPVTGQPDWATLHIRYRGLAIDHARLWQYLMAYRQHGAFHENCIERILADILVACQPEQLAVLGCFTRRGGIAINPLRLSDASLWNDIEQWGWDSMLRIGPR